MSPAYSDGDGGPRRDNDIDLEPNELGRDLGEALVATLRPAILDRDSSAFDPAEFAQPLHKGGGPLALVEGVPSPRNPMVGSFVPPAARAHRAATPPRRQAA